MMLLAQSGTRTLMSRVIMTSDLLDPKSITEQGTSLLFHVPYLATIGSMVFDLLQCSTYIYSDISTQSVTTQTAGRLILPYLHSTLRLQII